MTMQPVYGKKARVLMWIDVKDDENNHDPSVLNVITDPLDQGEFQLAHVLRRYYDWQGPNTGTHRRMGYFADYEAFYSTLSYWNRKFPNFIFALTIMDEFDGLPST